MPKSKYGSDGEIGEGRVSSLNDILVMKSSSFGNKQGKMCGYLSCQENSLSRQRGTW